jgi:uncharacterized protein HemX
MRPTPPEITNRDVKIIVLLTAAAIIAIIMLLASLGVRAQEKKEYKLTEVQQLKLKVTQQEAQLLQAQLQNIQRQFQDKVTQLMQEAQKVKLENGWAPETQFSPDTLVFSAPPPKEEKK